MVDLQTFLDVWLPVMAQTVGLGLLALSGVWVVWLCGRGRGISCLAVVFYMMLCMGGYVFFYFCTSFSWRFMPAAGWIVGWTAIFGCVAYVKAVLDEKKRKMKDTVLYPEDDI